MLELQFFKRIHIKSFSPIIIIRNGSHFKNWHPVEKKLIVTKSISNSFNLSS